MEMITMPDVFQVSPHTKTGVRFSYCEATSGLGRLDPNQQSCGKDEGKDAIILLNVESPLR